MSELPPEVIERLVRRPEDLPTHVEDNIKTYKSNMLRILEVSKQRLFNVAPQIVKASKSVKCQVILLVCLLIFEVKY